MATGDVTARTPLLFYLFGGVQLLLGGALTVVDWRGQAGETRAESDTGLQ
jgi:hypothetical protein